MSHINALRWPGHNARMIRLNRPGIEDFVARDCEHALEAFGFILNNGQTYTWGEFANLIDAHSSDPRSQALAKVCRLMNHRLTDDFNAMTFVWNFWITPDEFLRAWDIYKQYPGEYEAARQAMSVIHVAYEMMSFFRADRLCAAFQLHEWQNKWPEWVKNIPEAA